MEILLGVMILLQVVMLIQIMHRGKQVLQHLETLEKKMGDRMGASESIREAGVTECVTGDLKSEVQVSQVPSMIEQTEKTSPEELLNEVLSEVFS